MFNDLFLITWLFSSIYALVLGGKPEKIVALVFVFGALFTVLLSSTPSDRFYQAELGIMLVDSMMFSVFLYLALHAERFWTLWMTAMQAIQVFSHLPIILIPEILPQAYTAIIAIWSYPMLLLLVIATYRHQQRLKVYGKDRSWSDFSVIS